MKKSFKIKVLFDADLEEAIGDLLAQGEHEEVEETPSTPAEEGEMTPKLAEAKKEEEKDKGDED